MALQSGLPRIKRRLRSNRNSRERVRDKFVFWDGMGTQLRLQGIQWFLHRIGVAGERARRLFGKRMGLQRTLQKAEWRMCYTLIQ